MEFSQEEVEKLINYILDWWEEVKYDTIGKYGEYNLYDDEPSFVVKAKIMRKKIDGTSRENRIAT